jgi:pre-mRNA-processing factor 17
MRGRSCVVLVDSAPAVDDGDRDEDGMLIANDRQLVYNVPRSVTHNAPLAGPSHPMHGRTTHATNVWSGQADDVRVADYHFDDMFNRQRGVAAPVVSGDVPPKKKKRTKRAPEAARPGTGIALDKPFYLKSSQPWAEEPVVYAEEAIDGTGVDSDAAGAAGAPVGPDKAEAKTTIFHGTAEDLEDYQGRSWIDLPRGYKQGSVEKCRVPKKTVHTWSSHSKGVSAIRFHPSGHLLLSTSLDGTAKISRVHDNRKCMRTYLGHTKGIRTAEFAGSGGGQFVSSSFDKSVKLWDTETGAIVTSFDTMNSISFSLGTHPAHPSILLAGINKKIVQFDTRTGDNLQEYDYHLDAVNSITFVDEGRKFITSSDDKTIRVWEFGVPVQIQVIKDTEMHAASTASLSPDGTTWLGQNADNTIVSYSVTGPKVRQLKKKTFQGHSSAGYAIDVGMSPDSQYLYSGDGEGRVFLWSWKSRKVVKTLSAHQQVCVGCQWHPFEPSTLATCSWDGSVKLWG